MIFALARALSAWLRRACVLSMFPLSTTVSHDCSSSLLDAAASEDWSCTTILLAVRESAMNWSYNVVACFASKLLLALRPLNLVSISLKVAVSLFWSETTALRVLSASETLLSPAAYPTTAHPMIAMTMTATRITAMMTVRNPPRRVSGTAGGGGGGSRDGGGGGMSAGCSLTASRRRYA